ncbi:MAG: hypothetical protein ACETWK_09705 [Candidatus Aminicenantaceae bacterium]
MTVLLPSFDFNVFTLGFGYNLNGLHIDMGIEYLKGKERNVLYSKYATDPEWKSSMPGTYKMRILVPNFSVSYKF